MLALFLIILVFGICLLILSILKYKSLKRLKTLTKDIQSSDSFSAFSKNKNTLKLLEKHDKTLEFIRKLDTNTSIKLLGFFVVFVVFYLFISFFEIQLKKESLALIFILLLIAFIVLPGMIYKILIENKIKIISKNIPMFVDLLAVCIQAGMDIRGAMIFLQTCTQDVNKNFTPFLNKLITKSEISGLESALEDLSKELPSIEISMMCTTLKQSIKYGSAVYESLISLSMQIRQMELLATEEAIGSLSAKMSIPLILFFMFPVIIIIAAPGLMKILGGLWCWKKV